MLERLPTYTATELERRASIFLTQYPQATTSPPVDIDYLIESQPGVSLDTHRGLQQRLDIPGAVFKEKGTGRIIILIDESLADSGSGRNLYRFTLAEELGHIVLHRQIIEYVNSIEAFKEVHNHESWYEVERNAKRFGGAVLIPAKLVIAEAENLYAQIAGPFLRAGILGSATQSILNRMAGLMAATFQVSPISMEYRLREWPVRIADRVIEAARAELDYLP